MTKKSFKGVALVGDSQVNNADHLGPIAAIMGIPLLFLNESDTDLCKDIYPDIEIGTPPYSEFHAEYMISTYDVLFLSDLWPQNKFENTFGELQIKYKKPMRHVFCPHGYSDKSYYLVDCVNEDVPLIYGQNMLDLLKEHHVDHLLKQHVITGNYRYTYYKKHKEHFDKIVQERYLSQFEKKQTTLLYAPTWMDMEEASTFFDSLEALLDQLPDEYNMIVKLHPRLEVHSCPELDTAALYHHLIGKYLKKKNVVFVEYFPLVFPLLAATDIYIGDTTSVGYDFLIFNKPMFFLNKFRRDPKTDRNAYLFRAGVSVVPEDYKNLYKIINANLKKDQQLYSEVRKSIWDYTFGPERDFKDIKEDIITALKEKLNAKTQSRKEK